MTYQISAEYLKTKIIDYLIKKDQSVILGNEVMYGTKRKVVDLLMLDNCYLTGIEIKSATDNLNRLNEQVNEYRKIFNYTIICTTSNHYPQVHKIVPKDIGLLLFSNNTLLLKRKPRLRKILDKNEILYTIPSNYLRKELKIKNHSFNSDEIRNILLQESNMKIQSFLHSYLRTKLSNNYKIFKKGKGEESHIDDIPLLSLRATKVNRYE